MTSAKWMWNKFRKAKKSWELGSPLSWSPPLNWKAFWARSLWHGAAVPWSKHSASFSPGFFVSEIVHLDSDADQWFSAGVVCHRQHNTHTLTTEECVCVCVSCMHTHSWYLMLEARDAAEGLVTHRTAPSKELFFKVILLKDSWLTMLC